MNATILAMVLELECPKTVADLWPIACYNTIYKCIIKVSCRRLKVVLPDLLDNTQAAFVCER